jgi:hypothetical protein
MSNILRNRVKSRRISKQKYSSNVINNEILKKQILQIENTASISTQTEIIGQYNQVNI